MSKTNRILTLAVNIDTPQDGSRVEGTNVTVSGTASAHTEALLGSPNLSPTGPLGSLAEPKPSIKSVDGGDLADELTIPSGGSADGSFTDVTGQITQVQVQIGPGGFENATKMGESGREWERWTFPATLPQGVGPVTITARVLVGGQAATASVQVNRLVKKIGSFVRN